MSIRLVVNNRCISVLVSRWCHVCLSPVYDRRPIYHRSPEFSVTGLSSMMDRGPFACLFLCLLSTEDSPTSTFVFTSHPGNIGELLSLLSATVEIIGIQCHVWGEGWGCMRVDRWVQRILITCENDYCSTTSLRPLTLLYSNRSP